MLLGTLRFILASIVVFAHIIPTIGNLMGTYAVFGFYVISGYLMTFILNKNYGFNLSGIKSYFTNRILRIYPTYILLLIVSFIFLLIIGKTAMELNRNFQIPQNLSDWFRNLTLIGLGSSYEPYFLRYKLIPPAWALQIEFIFYLIIPILARTKLTTSLWVLGSITITILLFVYKPQFEWRYYTIWGATLPFSIGAIIFYLNQNLKLKNFLQKNFWKLLISSISITSINITVANIFNIYPESVLFYLNILFISILVLTLSNTPDKLVTKLKKLDRSLGDMSYPIYLIHWLVAALCINLFFNSFVDNNSSLRIPLFILTLCFSIIFSIIINQVFESKIALLRDKVRGFRIK